MWSLCWYCLYTSVRLHANWCENQQLPPAPVLILLVLMEVVSDPEFSADAVSFRFLLVEVVSSDVFECMKSVLTLSLSLDTKPGGVGVGDGYVETGSIGSVANRGFEIDASAESMTCST